jgi:hypothetical protein
MMQSGGQQPASLNCAHHLTVAAIGIAFRVIPINCSAVIHATANITAIATFSIARRSTLSSINITAIIALVPSIPSDVITFTSISA